MARRRQHPLTGAMYELQEDGEIKTVKVVTRGGEEGVFTAEGVWVEGALTHADPHMCLWLAGPQLPSQHRAALEEMVHD